MQFKFAGPKPPLTVSAAIFLAVFEGGLLFLIGVFYLLVALLLSNSVSFGGGSLSLAQEVIFVLLYAILGAAVVAAAFATRNLQPNGRGTLAVLQVPVILSALLNNFNWTSFLAYLVYAGVIVSLLYVPTASKQAFLPPSDSAPKP